MALLANVPGKHADHRTHGAGLTHLAEVRERMTRKVPPHAVEIVYQSKLSAALTRSFTLG